MALLKYGMKYSTIRYWQLSAALLYRYNGIYQGRIDLEQRVTGLASREVAYAAIALATHASPEHLKAVLAGTRGRRWAV